MVTHEALQPPHNVKHYSNNLHTTVVLSLVCLSAELGLAVICGPDRKSSIICQ